MIKVKKRIAVVFLFITIAITPAFSTGVPVIDISSITTTVTNFVQTIQQYNRQIQQWKSDFDRIAKAAKAMGSGDWKAALNGAVEILSVAGKYNSSISNISDFYGGAVDVTTGLVDQWNNLVDISTNLKDKWQEQMESGSLGSLWDLSADTLNTIANDYGNAAVAITDVTIKGIQRTTAGIVGLGNYTEQLQKLNDQKAEQVAKYAEAAAAYEQAIKTNGVDSVEAAQQAHIMQQATNSMTQIDEAMKGIAALVINSNKASDKAVAQQTNAITNASNQMQEQLFRNAAARIGKTYEEILAQYDEYGTGSSNEKRSMLSNLLKNIAKQAELVDARAQTGREATENANAQANNK